MATFILSTVFFLLLHGAVRRRSGRAFHVDLKLSRGIASVLLAAVGFASLGLYLPLWRQVFLAHHPDGSLPERLVLFVAAHFVADLLWIGWGKLSGRSEPRLDLVVHHLAGLAACAAALVLEFGYVLIAVAMTTEMMPVSTGLGAWAKVKRSEPFERLALRLSLAVSLGWRLPLWGLVFFQVATGRAQARVPDDPTGAFPIVLVLVGALILLDVFWVRQTRRRLSTFLARPRREALAER